MRKTRERSSASASAGFEARRAGRGLEPAETDRPLEPVRGRRGQQGAGDDEPDGGRGPPRLHHPAAADAGGDEAERAPQAHAAVVETRGLDAAHGNRLGQRHDRGPGDGEHDHAAEDRPEAARLRQQQQCGEARPREADEESAVIASAIGGKGDDGRGCHAHEQRRGGDDGDLARPEARPVEPEREERQVGADDRRNRRKQQRDAHGEGAPLALGVHGTHAALMQLGAGPG